MRATHDVAALFTPEDLNLVIVRGHGAYRGRKRSLSGRELTFKLRSATRASVSGTDELACEPPLVVVAILLQIQLFERLVVNANLDESVPGVRDGSDT